MTEREAIAKFIPDTWTHPGNINFLGLLFHLKLAGREFSNHVRVMCELQNEGKIELSSMNPDEALIRRTP